MVVSEAQHKAKPTCQKLRTPANIVMTIHADAVDDDGSDDGDDDDGADDDGNDSLSPLSP